MCDEGFGFLFSNAGNDRHHLGQVKRLWPSLLANGARHRQPPPIHLRPAVSSKSTTTPAAPFKLTILEMTLAASASFTTGTMVYPDTTNPSVQIWQ